MIVRLVEFKKVIGSCDHCFFCEELPFIGKFKMRCKKDGHSVELKDGWATELFLGCKYPIFNQEKMKCEQSLES